MIIAIRHPDKKMNYWICMNNGRPICGRKNRAADFSGDVIETAIRQVSALYPGCAVESQQRSFDRRKKKPVS